MCRNFVARYIPTKSFTSVGTEPLGKLLQSDSILAEVGLGSCGHVATSSLGTVRPLIGGLSSVALPDYGGLSKAPSSARQRSELKFATHSNPTVETH